MRDRAGVIAPEPGPDLRGRQPRPAGILRQPSDFGRISLTSCPNCLPCPVSSLRGLSRTRLPSQLAAVVPSKEYLAMVSLAEALVDWRNEGHLDPPSRPADVPPIPPPAGVAGSSVAESPPVAAFVGPVPALKTAADIARAATAADPAQVRDAARPRWGETPQAPA